MKCVLILTLLLVSLPAIARDAIDYRTLYTVTGRVAEKVDGLGEIINQLQLTLEHRLNGMEQRNRQTAINLDARIDALEVLSINRQNSDKETTGHIWGILIAIIGGSATTMVGMWMQRKFGLKQA